MLTFLLLILLLILLLYITHKQKKRVLVIKNPRPNRKLLKKKQIKLQIEPVDIIYYKKLKEMKKKLDEDRLMNNSYKAIIKNVKNVNNDNNVNNVNNDNNVNNVNNDIIEEIHIEGDRQNVHDSTVQDTIKKKYKKLKECTKCDNKNIEGLRNEIIDYAIKQNKMKDNLIDILNEIYNRNSTIINLEGNPNELDILNIVWLNEKLRDQIINELYDSYKDGYLVCPTGVVSRLINADVILNPEETPRTTEMLRNEMLNIASNIRNQCENYDNEYKKIEDEDKKNEYVKCKIRDKITTVYKDIIDIDIIQNELNSWIEYI